MTREYSNGRSAYRALLWGVTAAGIAWQFTPIGPTWALYALGLLWAFHAVQSFYGKLALAVAFPLTTARVHRLGHWLRRRVNRRLLSRRSVMGYGERRPADE